MLFVTQMCLGTCFMSTASLLHTLGGCAIDITSHYQPSPCNDTDPTKRY